MKKIRIALGLVFGLFVANAQVEPSQSIGQWKCHYSLNYPNNVTFDANQKLFIASTNTAMVLYNPESNEIYSYDETHGLSDFNLAHVIYNDFTQKNLIVYLNGNFDIFTKSGIKNYPDFKNFQISGNKSINGVMSYNQFVFLSTGIGLVKFDLQREEIKESYPLSFTGYQNCLSSIVIGDSLYVTGDKGTFKAWYYNNNLLDFNQWEKISDTSFVKLALYNNKLLCASKDSLYQYQNGKLYSVFHHSNPNLNIANLTILEQDVFICYEHAQDLNGAVVRLNSAFQKQEEWNSCIYKPQAVAKSKGTLIVADTWSGLQELKSNNQCSNKRINSPYSNSFYNFLFVDQKMYCPAGSHKSDWSYIYNRDGVQVYSNNEWSVIRSSQYPQMDTFLDILDIKKDPKTGSLFMASYGDGLGELTTDHQFKIYKEPYLPSADQFNRVRVSSLDFDSKGNLWMLICGTNTTSLAKRTPEGVFTHVLGGLNAYMNIVSNIYVDKNDQIWICTPRGNGLWVYDPNRTSNALRRLQIGEGQGNLPSEIINCIEPDIHDNLWIGTKDGVAIISCSEYVLDRTCEAELKPVIGFTTNGDYLFGGENVKTIAADGSGKKWIGTENGVWLINDNADSIILKFNVNNSPLPSNDILKIAINPTNGEVFFATDNGLVSYRGEATLGKSENESELTVFPNPFPKGYTGKIAIRGVSANANFKIIDSEGKMVYQGIAEGGQAIWDGYNYLGEKASTGVYFVLILGEKGSQTKSTKFILYE